MAIDVTFQLELTQEFAQKPGHQGAKKDGLAGLAIVWRNTNVTVIWRLSKSKYFIKKEVKSFKYKHL